MKGLLHEALNGLTMRYKAQFAHIYLKAKPISAVGVVGFPAFYVLWGIIFVQPYENIYIRMIGCVICAIIWISDRLPDGFSRFLPAYCYGATILCLPFFFTFMMLMNNVNEIWLGSAVCSVIYLTLLMDSWNVLVAYVIGSALAIVGVFIVNDGSIPISGYLHAMPIFAFALIAGFLLDYYGELLQIASRMRAVSAVGSSVAHEMRTPLLGIRLDIQTVSDVVAPLLSLGDAGPLSAEDRADLAACLTHIHRQVTFANTMIDMLLMNISEPRIEATNFGVHGMAGVVGQALADYPFKGDEHDRVVWHLDPDTDFAFRGSDLLMRHVLFNLLKNGLRALATARRGTLTIRLDAPGGAGQEPTRPASRLIVRDTGTGIPAALLPHVFEPFHTTGVIGDSRVGIGLAFCRRVVESFGGTITGRSEEGVFTEFEIALPPVVPAPAPTT